MRFDLADLRLYLAVVEAGSITHGAAAAHLSLAAASERLGDMETAAGVPLLVRGRRGTVPTEAGETLAHHARRILRQMAEMHDALGAQADGLRPTLRLLVNTAAMTEFLPERLGPWLVAHPHIDVDLRERESSEIVDALRAGLADAGIVSDAVDLGALRSHPFAVDRLVVVVACGHRLATQAELSFADVVHERLVGLARGALQDHLDRHAARIGQRLKFRARLRTFEAICGMVSQGVGVGIVPEQAARRCAARVPLVSIALRDAWAARRLSVCYRSDEDLSAPAQALVAHLTFQQRA